MNAIDFLVKEHDRVRKLLTNICDKSHRYETKRKMFEALGDDLIRHETMEHRVWYPHLRNNRQLNEEVKHLLKEENYAEREIRHLSEIKNESVWEEHFASFKKNVEHHAKEEERELFPEVQKLFSTDELETIGSEMYNFKRQYHRHH